MGLAAHNLRRKILRDMDVSRSADVKTEVDGPPAREEEMVAEDILSTASDVAEVMPIAAEPEHVAPPVEPEIVVPAPVDEFAGMTKRSIQAIAEEKFGVHIDPSLSKADHIARIRELMSGRSAQ